jgi:Stress responsive A/B Barrel Domain
VIQHIVLLKLRPQATDDEIRAAFDAGSDLPNEIGGVTRISYGRDRSQPAHGFTLVSVVELDDEDALDTYMHHPRRLEWIDRHVAPLTEDRIELDVPSDGAHLPTNATWYWGIASALPQ